MADVVVDPASDSGEQSASIGDVVVVRLEEIPTSGYRWEVDSVEPDVLEAADDTFTPADEAGLGGSGTHEFRFNAVGTGKADLKLVRRRAWETDDASDPETFETTIRVED